ncbi:MAG TPA: hypothetical protein VF591_02790 [Pyrinomonadaceae bacterium]|jgi:hypothetical protein
MNENVKNAVAPDNPGKDGGSEKLKTWLPLVLPALATSVFGFLVWNAQTAIQQKVDNIEQQNKVQLAQFQSQLSLKEDFYKRRLEVYEKACQQIAEAEASLADYGATDEASKRATDVVKALYRFRKGNQLYWSGQLDQHLDELWELGIRKLRPPQGPEAEQLAEQLNAEIAQEIKELHAQMMIDLNVRAFQDFNAGSPEESKGAQSSK